MTENKNLKERIRARMERTGESYTAARAQILKEDADAAPPEVDPAARVRHALEEGKERARRWPQTPQGYVDTRAAMTVLVRSFPSLRDASGAEPFDVATFMQWLAAGHAGGAKRAGRFILHVWNQYDDFVAFGRELGIEDAEHYFAPFNLSEALGVWDSEHCRAFLAWAEAPFWP